MSGLTDILPAPVRQKVYLTYGLVGVGIGGTQAGFAAASVDQPLALTVTWAVYGYLGVALGFTAAANTNQPPKQQRWTPHGPYDV